MTVESVTQAVSNLALQFGEEDADPGAMCDARAIGSASEGVQSFLQEVYHKSLMLKDAIKSSLAILEQVMEEKLNATNIEVIASLVSRALNPRISLKAFHRVGLTVTLGQNSC
ncbi:hypothetical protein AAFF_G00197890 [Aldrovandia affinis]|uniref:Uncharacterized protein n=1 Tax=Aldrovandia affinis TaxID=143900 RepID=A0AAD7RJ31_9TELE|nr:hypothetical protein AAFF_G00197890 [Aldrovandia affinis]